MGVMVDILGMLSYIAGSYLDYFITVLEFVGLVNIINYWKYCNNSWYAVYFLKMLIYIGLLLE